MCSTEKTPCYQLREKQHLHEKVHSINFKRCQHILKCRRLLPEEDTVVTRARIFEAVVGQQTRPTRWEFPRRKQRTMKTFLSERTGAEEPRSNDRVKNIELRNDYAVTGNF